MKFEQTLLKYLRKNDREWKSAYQRIDGIECFCPTWGDAWFPHTRLAILVWRGLIQKHTRSDPWSARRYLPSYRIAQ